MKKILVTLVIVLLVAALFVSAAEAKPQCPWKQPGKKKLCVPPKPLPTVTITAPDEYNIICWLPGDCP